MEKERDGIVKWTLTLFHRGGFKEGGPTAKDEEGAGGVGKRQVREKRGAFQKKILDKERVLKGAWVRREKPSKVNAGL